MSVILSHASRFSLGPLTPLGAPVAEREIAMQYLTDRRWSFGVMVVSGAQARARAARRIDRISLKYFIVRGTDARTPGVFRGRPFLLAIRLLRLKFTL